MATTGPFFLAICFALFLTACSLQCYTKNENECSPSGPICDAVAPASVNVANTVTECDADVTMCSKVTYGGSGRGFTFKSEIAGCLPKEDGESFISGCYDKDDLAKMYPTVAEGLKQIEEQTGITLDTIEGCTCDGNLCNGSVKSVFSISVVISSVVMSFMLLM